jgi:hypothetical protein
MSGERRAQPAPLPIAVRRRLLDDLFRRVLFRPIPGPTDERSAPRDTEPTTTASPRRGATQAGSAGG